MNVGILTPEEQRILEVANSLLPGKYKAELLEQHHFSDGEKKALIRAIRNVLMLTVSEHALGIVGDVIDGLKSLWNDFGGCKKVLLSALLHGASDTSNMTGIFARYRLFVPCVNLICHAVIVGLMVELNAAERETYEAKFHEQHPTPTTE